MIQQLREDEEVMLYALLLNISNKSAWEVAEYLAQAYQEESLNYPHQAPPFEIKAALWGASTVYIAAQLMLYRENKVAEVNSFLPPFDQAITPGAVLSVDLCLRFLPDIVRELKNIDQEDLLIPLLEDYLKTWHFSGVNYRLADETLDFTVIQSNQCVHQLYADRIVTYKALPRAKHPAIQHLIKANMGNFGTHLWSQFNRIENE
ncbi:MAG: hypothetical protein AAF985_23335 [Bacteroidota bacterium]